ncbi:S8 family peptidase [Micromonospora inositola]|uniref:Serine protease, subtilisin family n=1 Tax=Micromonospora inositola TaxID=47865 RepID=A0A1C5JXH9_9ACTN|nr:S8 family peptidase [Micromonospora inositola]SCG75233.1 Serine protease, subtilisin family [Micromonospora inositola]
MQWPPRWLTAGAVGALVVGLAGPASADLPARPAGPIPAAPAPGAAPVRLTLITGDQVDLVQAAPGRVAATVHPGAGRERVTFHTVQADGGLRVLPSDVVPYVSAGVLDPNLFDVQELAAEGYGDAAQDALPLIVRYQAPAAGRVRPLAGATAARPLESINGAALRVGKGNLDELWTMLRGTPAARTTAAGPVRLGAGIARVWLDGRVHPALEHSVPQIGAPAAWAAGRDGSGVRVAVLDTGVDATHPDLAGRIAEAQDFSGSGSARDGHGHGTHVAATIAGSGAASDGLRKGVAPGAQLLIGKVLDDGGSGYDSGIIAGMEWAVHSGAKVVSMSLGGPPTDGTDPMSQAVNDLTAETGALFVIAAGNSGEAGTVGTPGAASAALTVGAVDRDDNLADFSSRGPRLGDNGLKPEITAPGVGIVAARAAGTTMGTPVDDAYTKASGTSMATPHVAGAAAILAQEHPDWTAGKLKDALVSTAKNNSALTVFEQGAGRVDVARALSQRVYGSATADFGRLSTGGAVAEKTVTYTNGTGAAQTLRLALELRNLDTGAAETDGVSAGVTEVTVPAGGSVAVPLRADPAKLDRGPHGGWLVATGADGVAVRTAVGLTLSGPIHTVSLRALDMAGQPGLAPVATLFGEHSESDHLLWLPPGGAEVQVEEGPYLLEGLIEHGAPLDEQITLVTDPELMVDRDLTVVLDPRKGTPVRIETPKPTEQRAAISFYEHRVFGNGRQIDHGVMTFSTIQQVNVTPTRPVSQGEFEFASRWQLVAPMVDARISGVSGPLDINLLGQSPAPTGRRKLPLVWGGTGTAAELAGARGAAVLVTGSLDRSEDEQIAAATAAGAATVLIVRPADWSAWTVWRPDGDRLPIPSLVVAYDDGQRLIAAARAGGAMLDLTLTVDSPYLYDVWQVSKGRVPERIVHTVTADNTAEVTARYADTGGFDWASEQRFGWRPWQEYSWNDDQRMVRTGTTRQEFVSAGDSWWQQRVLHQLTWSWGQLTGGLTQQPRRYDADDRVTETWHSPVVRPAVPAGSGAPVPTRTGDNLNLWLAEYVDADGHYAPAGGSEEQDTVQARLSRDGQQIADLSGGWVPVPTTPDPARYRLDLTTQRSSDEWRWATRTETAWQFTSARPAGDAARPLPLLQVDYQVPADLRGEVPGGRPHQLGLTVRQPAGLPAPTGVGVRVEVSFDGGHSWTTVPVHGSGIGFNATVPAGRGTVSLRVHAGDRVGNTVDQTVIDAYGLR